jgi:hypothetical protein
VILRAGFGQMPVRTLNRVLAATLALSAAAYVLLAARFFPDGQGKLGDDYEYFQPLLLAGKYWIAENGLFAVPRFSPAFCGGLPLLANPQSLFYSVPQALSLAMDPVASVLATTLVFAGLGAGGTYALMRRRFGVSIPAASLSAILFLFNGFLLHRMAAGHATYHAVGLLPLLCYVLLTPLPAAPVGRMVLRAAGPVAAAAAILAYVVYAGAPNILVPLGITCVIVWLVHALTRKPVAAFWIVGAAAAAIGAATAAAKLAPAVVFIHNFPRLHELMIFDHALELAHALFLGLFAPSFLPDHFWIVGKHEFDFGVGLAPLLLLLAAYHRFRAGRQWRLGGVAKGIMLAALLALLALPLCLNYGGPDYAAWLKSLPYIGDNVILARWFLVYLMPLIVGAGLALDFVFPATAQRSLAAVAGMLLTVLPPLVADRPVYDIEPYDPAPVLAAAQTLRATGSPPAIAAIGGSGAFGERNNGLAEGRSGFPCYEPLFGYHLESFPPGLATGPLHSESPGAAHLRNPACYIYGRENGCVPGDTFSAARREDEAAFAAYRPFGYVLPAWQRWADWASTLGLAMILLGFALALGLRCRELSPRARPDQVEST